jgi:alcohol dehydrogenase class IV
MNQRLGLPSGLKALDVRSDQFPQIIQGALHDHCHLMNPRIADASDYENMLYESM